MNIEGSRYEVVEESWCEASINIDGSRYPRSDLSNSNSRSKGVESLFIDPGEFVLCDPAVVGRVMSRLASRSIRLKFDARLPALGLKG
jgi:hypothetical protein